MNINDLLFSSMKAENKLEAIRRMSDDDVRKATETTILSIVKECKNKGGKFYINSERVRGNNWCSNIEHIYEYKGKAYLCLYVQNTNTDSSTCVSYSVFNSSSRYYGYCENLNKSFTYDAVDIACTIRCILEEYVYYKYIEKEERERKEKISRILDWKIYNPVCNRFYNEWRCRYESEWKQTPNTDRYHRAEKAVKDYVDEHLDELLEKTTEELQSIYTRIFRETK